MNLNTPRRLAVALLAAALALATGCQSLQPRVAFEKMTIQRLSLDETEYVALCQVANPNGYDLRIDEVRWTLHCQGRELASGEVNKTSELPAGKTLPLRVYIDVPKRQLDKCGLSNDCQYDYQFSGLVKMSGPLGPATATVAAAGRLPVLHPLEVELVGVDYLGLTETRVGVTLQAKVTNPNDIVLTPSKLDGTLLIDERPLVRLTTELDKAQELPAQSTTTMAIPVWVSSPELGVRSLGKTFAEPQTRYRLIGAMQFRVPGAGDVKDVLSPPIIQTQSTSR